MTDGALDQGADGFGQQGLGEHGKQGLGGDDHPPFHLS